MILTGGCLCGEIRYACDTESNSGYLCHCCDCQRESGGPFVACLLVGAAQLRLEKGAPVVYSAPGGSGNLIHREHCGTCGSPLFSSSRSGPEWRVIRIGSLDDPGRIEPRLHIWVDSAQPWALPDDGHPRFAQGPGSPTR